MGASGQIHIGEIEQFFSLYLFGELTYRSDHWTVPGPPNLYFHHCLRAIKSSEIVNKTADINIKSTVYLRISLTFRLCDGT